MISSDNASCWQFAFSWLEEWQNEKSHQSSQKSHQPQKKKHVLKKLRHWDRSYDQNTTIVNRYHVGYAINRNSVSISASSNYLKNTIIEIKWLRPIPPPFPAVRFHSSIKAHFIKVV